MRRYVCIAVSLFDASGALYEVANRLTPDPAIKGAAYLMVNEQVYYTVDIDRRGYGRRYTALPVDALSRTEFVIDFTGAYMRPEMIDIRVEDVVRWREGERRLEGRVISVEREQQRLQASISDVRPVPVEEFYP